MGHPKLKRKTYSGPTHPWQKERIEEEKALLKEFGLKNKKEVWRVASLLRKYTKQAKKLIALNTPQAEVEEKQLLKKLISLGILNDGAKVEDVLSLTAKDFFNRRLQTLVCRKGLAKTVRQARQFIVHGHISVKENKVAVPSYFVSKEEELIINFIPSSELSRDDHPERQTNQKEPMAPKEEKKTEDQRKDKRARKPRKKEEKSRGAKQ